MNYKGETAMDIAESDQELRKKFHKILVCKALAQAGGRQGLQKRDREDKEPTLESYDGMSKVIYMVVGLMISVSFNSAFAVPGGYYNEGSGKGKATPTKKPLLMLFIITDSIALFLSIFSTLLLCFSSDTDLLVAAISIAVKLMIVALISLYISFMLGLSLFLSEGLAILVYLMCPAVFFLGCHWFWTKFPLLDLCFKISFPKSLSSVFGLFHSNSN